LHDDAKANAVVYDVLIRLYNDSFSKATLPLSFYLRKEIRAACNSENAIAYLLSDQEN
jgi:hypothetical protein